MMRSSAVMILLTLMIPVAGEVNSSQDEKTRAPQPAPGVPREFKVRFFASYEKAADWLASQQMKNGAWGRIVYGKEFPSMGLTALATYALAVTPGQLRSRYEENVDQGVQYILAHQEQGKEHHGSFYEAQGTLRAYVTSISIMALLAVDPKLEKYEEQVRAAAKYLQEIQSKEGFFSGGTGYGEEEIKIKEGKAVRSVSDRPNLSTTAMAAEALNQVQRAGVELDPAYWKRLVEFVNRLQNHSESNVDPEWLKYLEEKGFKVGNDGSVGYTPKVDEVDKYAGRWKDTDGKWVVQGYGSMTYNAIKTYIYAGLKKDDPRVEAAVNWCREHWNLDAHPGFPYEKGLAKSKRRDQQGMFYYYVMMTKALHAWGERPFVTADGKKHDWVVEIAGKFMERQNEKGSWENPNPRWWEDQETLVTPYALIAYSILAGYMEGK